jgi:OOP family OmpA-OmpF porin
MKKIAVSSLLCLLSFSALQAEEVEYKFSISPMIGQQTRITNSMDLDNSTMYGIRFGVNIDSKKSIEIGFDKMYDVKQIHNINEPKIDISQITLNLMYNFNSYNKLTPYAVGGVGFEMLDGNNVGNNYDSGLLNLGAGIKYPIYKDIALRAEMRDIYRLRKGGHRLAYSLGLYIPFGEIKKEKVVEPKKIEVPLDSDKDGIYDSIDKCPNTPSGVNVNEEGCPLDSDKDGVYDYLDKCENTPLEVGVDEEGCPIDSDKDSVYDYLDKCENTPLGVSVDSNGCPLDSDKDGVYDYLDKCPDTPLNFEVDKNGCVVSVTININFATSSYKVPKDYLGEINKISDFMKKHESVKLLLEGYTDNRGNKNFNKKLSKNRAESVKKEIIKTGINSDRIEAVGYGELNPIADNNTKEGRLKNRRVIGKFSY